MLGKRKIEIALFWKVFEKTIKRKLLILFGGIYLALDKDVSVEDIDVFYNNKIFKKTIINKKIILRNFKIN